MTKFAKEASKILGYVHEDDFDKIYKGEVSKSGTAVLPSKRAKRMPEKAKLNLEISEENKNDLKKKSEEISEEEKKSTEDTAK